MTTKLKYLLSLAKPNRLFSHCRPKFMPQLYQVPKYYSCSGPCSNRTKQKMSLIHSKVSLSSNELYSFETKGSISLVEREPKVPQQGRVNSPEGEQLLTFIFNCGKCSTRSTRSFAKAASQKGVVVIKCDKCEHMHLIADHLGLFQDNYQMNSHGSQSQAKYWDPIETARFFNLAFKENSKKFESQQSQEYPMGRCSSSENKCLGTSSSKCQKSHS